MIVRLKCKHCGHEMIFVCGFPEHVEWFCEACNEYSDNYGVDLRSCEIHWFREQVE